MNQKHLAHDTFDLNDLLHPAQAFESPMDVVHDPDLTLNEKRAILAAWASDACAVESAPGSRRVPGGTQPVQFDDVIDALRSLDRQLKDGDGAPNRRILRRKPFMYRPPKTQVPQHSLN